MRKYSLHHRRSTLISSFNFSLKASTSASGKDVSSVLTGFELLLVLLMAVVRSLFVTSPGGPWGPMTTSEGGI